MSMRVSKGLAFPMVALSCVGNMPAKGENEQEAARVFFVAAMRATQRLVIGVGRDEGLEAGSAHDDRIAPPYLSQYSLRAAARVLCGGDAGYAAACGYGG